MKTKKIQILPFPDGKDFAVSFIDDTDLSTRENTEPVYEFLYNHNIRGTKTVWVTRQKRTSSFRREDEKSVDSESGTGSTLEDKDYLQFIYELERKGYEIALHGIAAGNSYRNEIIEGIERFKTIFGAYPKINVFHERNIENLYAGSHKLDFWPFKILEKLKDRSDYLGHVDGSPYFWGDIAKNIKYMRLPFHNIEAVNTLKVNPNMPFHDSKRHYVNYWFSSSDGADCERFVRLLRDDNIRKLEKERGACLIYTHFAKGFAKKVNNSYQLDEGFRKVITNLANNSNAWFPTASELLDRLLAIKMVTVEQSGQTVSVVNGGGDDIVNLVLKVSPGFELTDERGKIHHASEEGKISIDCLKGHSTLIMHANQTGYSLLPSRDTSISCRERTKIEFYNYYSLLKHQLSNHAVLRIRRLK